MHAEHGYFSQEQILGNTFVVNLKVGIEDIPITDLHETIDYAELLRIVKLHFGKKFALLESLAQAIEGDVKLHFPQILTFELSIRKLNPPLSAEVGCSEIILEKSYSGC
ncbi:MAG: dihydroneopterin aldolase [Chitinophagaceae bacterium]|nr:dihydroneopterin aldolase [Chitinophagaceae bacterium]